ncbi:SRPBCC domain-containing protein [Streptomyces sp. NBC_00370]|uniref:SRPBCC domain-containing protein n=1 Tax=Streptomyces sp. NBC_00370 TaxID=2975728 RepID=UPI002E2566CD
MDHEVFVPVPAEILRQTLRDPARVAGCLPGLQQDADDAAGQFAGRLKVRIGGHTITYRGTLTVTEQDGAFSLVGEGTEARGSGSARVTLTIRPTEAPEQGGTLLALRGETDAKGRLAELPPDKAEAAGRRLLDRFAARLTEESTAGAAGPVAAAGAVPEQPAEADPAAGGSPADSTAADDVDEPGAPEPGTAPEAGAGEIPGEIPDVTGEIPDLPEVPDAPRDSVFDTPVPQPPLDGETTSGEGDFHLPDDLDGGAFDSDEPPAEAAHARRTMIGRSAEEVDHAPPRGRYAPVPAPEAVGARATLRWVGPAAALALASAVVVGRALRRRR